MRDVEKYLDKYLESGEAEKQFNNYFSAIRKAYLAGFKAASDMKQPGEPNIQLLRAEGSSSSDSSN